MRFLIRLAVLIFILFFGGLVVWMNLTPGYFQYGPCGLRVGYYADWEIFNTQVKCPSPNQQNPYYVSRPRYFLNNFLLLMSRLDFNRGPNIVPPVNTNNQDKINKASSPSSYVPSAPEISSVSQLIYKYGPEKSAEVVVQDGSYYGPPFDPKLFQLEISQSHHLFAKSETVDLKNYLGKRVKIRYKEVVGIVMGEQQLVMVDSVGL